jgi:putative ATPase
VDLFTQSFQTDLAGAPLAHRMRPLTLAELHGHEAVLGERKPLRAWIEADRVPSLILWGPPGCGKTTLARIIAARTAARFESLSAVLSGVREIKEIAERAREARLSRSKTLLFVDEIHRFNKAQQDALLPHVEDGTLTLIGATTENPSFELNSALLSRARVIRLEALAPEAIESLLRRALSDPVRGYGGGKAPQLSDEALRWLARTADGDARKALTALETLAPAATASAEPLSAAEAERALESALRRQPIRYDKNGEEHHNVVSAFIKSLRDSDPHAGLYYLARMLEGGEDPLFIVRRMVILASEDIGNADPRALQVALAVKDAVDFVGMPEARISLAQAVTYLALAPKSNASYRGICEALEEVRSSGALPVPLHLRNGVTGLMRREGYGKGYRYAHDERGGRALQTHLPERLLGRRFYRPTDQGLEKALGEKLARLNPEFDGGTER